MLPPLRCLTRVASFPAMVDGVGAALFPSTLFRLTLSMDCVERRLGGVLILEYGVIGRSFGGNENTGNDPVERAPLFL